MKKTLLTLFVSAFALEAGAQNVATQVAGEYVGDLWVALGAPVDTTDVDTRMPGQSITMEAGVAEGTATITVTTSDGNHTATCTVTVSADAPVSEDVVLEGEITEDTTLKANSSILNLFLTVTMLPISSPIFPGEKHITPAGILEPLKISCFRTGFTSDVIFDSGNS